MTVDWTAVTWLKRRSVTISGAIREYACKEVIDGRTSGEERGVDSGNDPRRCCHGKSSEPGAMDAA